MLLAGSALEFSVISPSLIIDPPSLAITSLHNVRYFPSFSYPTVLISITEDAEIVTLAPLINSSLS